MKLKFALVAVAAVLATAATVANALPKYAITFIFYSDLAHTAVVGEGHRDCRNNWTIFWGEKTQYPETKEEYECPVGN